MASEGFQKDFIIYNPDRYNSVTVTGSWCNWSEQGHKLTKVPGLYWIATVTLPHDTKVQYKYIINGNWQTDPDDKTETDASGNTNNVFQVPPKSALGGGLVGGTHDTKTEPIVQQVVQNHAPALPTGGSALPATGASQDKDLPAGHNVADAGVAAAAAKTASQAGLGYDEHESQSKDLAGPGAAGSGLTHVPTGGAVAATGVAAAAAQAANKAGLGHDEHEHNAGATAAGPAAATDGLSHVPTGGSVAQAGVAQDAAREAASHGLGKDGSTVGGTTKVAPGVVEAVPGSGNVAGVSDSSLTQPGTSTRAPLPASTGDAPHAPESAHHGEGKGLFGVLGGLGAAAAGVAAAVVHKVQEGESPVAAVKQATSSPKGPAEALSPIAQNDATSKISHDLAQVDLKHTKDEVVHGIEKIGGVLAGGLVGLGGLIDGSDGRLGGANSSAIDPAAAKQGSALSNAAFGIRATHPESVSSANLGHTPAVSGVIPNLLPASLSSSFGAPDAQRTFASTGGPTSAAPLGSAAAAPAVGDGSLPVHQVANPIPAGTINNIAGAVGSSATTRESPAVATSAGAPTTDTTAASSPVPGLAINKTSSAAGTSTSAPNVPGLAINGSSSSSAATAATPAAAEAASSSTSQDKSAKRGSSIADKLKSGLGGSSSSKKDEQAGGSGVSAPVGSSENATSAGRAIREDKPSVQAGQAEPATSGLAATPASTVSKKDTSALGKGQPGAAAPATPKKGGHAAESSSATPASEGYKTAPSTPATPADRKRKSSIFKKIKGAFSPSK